MYIFLNDMIVFIHIIIKYDYIQYVKFVGITGTWKFIHTSGHCTDPLFSLRPPGMFFHDLDCSYLAPVLEAQTASVECVFCAAVTSVHLALGFLADICKYISLIY